MRLVAGLVTALLLSAGTPSEAKSVQKEFWEVWAQRDDAYAADYTELLKEAQERGKRFVCVREQWEVIQRKVRPCHVCKT